MSLNHRQQHQLTRIESRLLRSDPHLAAMLSVFTRLSAGERMPSWEQIAGRLDRIRQAAAQVACAIRVMVAAIIVLIGAVLGLITAAFAHRGSRRPAPAPQRPRRGREAGGTPNPAAEGG